MHPALRVARNVAVFLGGVGLALWLGHSGSRGLTPPEGGERMKAPELEGAVDWIGVEKPPLRLADLRGKVVLLDFWTYG